MTVSENIYNVGKIKQLIDLNSDRTNFELNFKVSSKNNLPFYAIVVNQKTLDNDDKLDYKHVTNGIITGNIVSDKNVYQSYFLLLKADEPCECNVTLDIKDIPANIPPPPPPQPPVMHQQFPQQPGQQFPQQPGQQFVPQPGQQFPQQPGQPFPQQPELAGHKQFPQQLQPSQGNQQPLITGQQPSKRSSNEKSSKTKKESSNINYKYIIIGIVIFAVIILIYNYYTPPQTSNDLSTAKSSTISTKLELPPPPPVAVATVDTSSSIVSDIKNALNANDMDLINRLNSLNLNNL